MLCLGRTKGAAIFAAFSDPAMAFVFLKQLWDGGFTGARFAFIDYDDKYLTQFGAFTDGLFVPGAFVGKYKADYLQRYRAHYREEPDVYSAEAYDLLRTAIKALAAQGRSGAGLQDRVLKLDHSDAAIPGFGFNADRTVHFPMGVLIAKAGHFVPYEGGR